MFFDCHLMVEHPENYIDSFAAAGADMIVVHAEATHHLHRVLQTIHSKGIQAGVALNPASPPLPGGRSPGRRGYDSPDERQPGVWGPEVHPGQRGQNPPSEGYAGSPGTEDLIEVDGGVNAETAKQVREAGANVLVAGSYIFGAPDRQEAIAALR